MRNLKRALSLALAFVMVMSLMIVGTSAKSYTDADKIDNQAAVEVLGEIGVMVGNDDGSFAPDRDVTRAEMAVILTRILYGNNMNVDQFKGLNTFTDVPDWAEGFVNLCASLDIIAGRGNGIFDPDATVTTAEAALMLSRALGYFKNNAEFGNDWALAAMKRATQAGIIGGDMVLQANAGLDRDDVAQMTFNTLTKAVPVQYNELLDVYYNVNQGIIYALEFNYLQTLGYTNFGLVYKTNETTIYGRPATTWGTGYYNVKGETSASGIEKADLTAEGGLIASNVRMLDKDQIITVANTPDYVYTQDTAEEDVYDDLGATLCNDAKGQKASEEYDWTAFVNGEEVEAVIPEKNEGGDYTYTAKGSVTEIYIDDYDQTVTVVEINYYLGQVSDVDEDEGTTTIRALSDGGKVLDERTFATTAYDEDAYVVFTVDFNDDNDFYICELMAPETATGEVTVVDNDDRDNTTNNANDTTYVCLDDDEDTKYYYTSDDHNVYDLDDDAQTHPELDEEYILYMTPAGYVLGYKLANETVDQYLYVQDSDEELRDWIGRVVLPDATNPKVDLDSDLNDVPNDAADINGNLIGDEIRWSQDNEVAKDATNIDELIWKYSVNSNDVYSLTYVKHYTMDDAEINNGESFVNDVNQDTSFIVDKQTIFVDVEGGKAYTGYNEVPNVADAKIAYVLKDGVAEIVFILDGEIYDENQMFFMLTSTDRTSRTYDGDKYWKYADAYVDGKNQPLFIAYDALPGHANEALQVGVLYEVMKTKDEQYITEIRVNNDARYDVVAVGDDAFRIENGETVNKQKYTTDDETIFVVRESLYKKDGSFDEYKIYRGDIDDMFVGVDEDNMMTTVSVVKADGQYAQLVYIWLYEAPVYSNDASVKSIKVKGVEAAEVADNEYSVTLTNTQAANTTEKLVDIALNDANARYGTLSFTGSYTGTWENHEEDTTTAVTGWAPQIVFTFTVTAADGTRESYKLTVNVDADAIEVANSTALAAALADPSIKTIYMADGRYVLTTGNVINRELTIIGSDNTEVYAADSNSADGFQIATNQDVTIKNITFKGSAAKLNHGIQTTGSAGNILIENCVFDNLYSGIYLNGGKGTIKNCSFTYSGTQNAINIDGLTGNLNIENCTFDGPAGQKDIYCANGNLAMQVFGQGFTIGY